MGLFSALFGGSSQQSSGGQRKRLTSAEARQKIHHVIDGLYRAKRFGSLTQQVRDSVSAQIGGLVENGQLRYRDRSNQSKAILKICVDEGLDKKCGQMIRDRVMAIFE